MAPRTGILYLLTCSTGGKRYIGITSIPWKDRWRCHKNWAARGGRGHLQAAIRKYGSDAFTMRVLCKADWEELNRLEPLAIKSYETLSPNGYNLASGGEQFLHSEETRQKISAILTGRTHSAETKRKISRAHMGKKVSAETCRRISEAKKGTVLSDETRRKMSESRTGHVVSAETRKKIGDANRGRGHPRSEETRRKISEGLKGRIVSPETRKKISDAKRRST